jgi:iron complex outermembrane receptor protein
MKRILFLIFLFLFGFTSLIAQPVIKGTVKDKRNGETLAGVNVYFIDYSHGTVTDEKGNYILKGAPKGEFIVKFSYIGYQTIIKNVVVAKQDIILNIEMEQAIIEGEEVVITGSFAGSQHENIIKVNTISPRKLLQSGTPSFIEALTEVPGVAMISKGPGVGTPVIRGLSLSNILFLNNGVPMQNFQFSENHPFMVDDYGIERVEIVKGPASLLYGSGAVAGVINIIKESPAPEGKIIGDFNLKYFSNTFGLSSNLGVKGANKGFSWGLRGGVNSNTDYYDGDINRIPNTRFKRKSTKINLGFIKPIGFFRLFYDYNKDDLGMAVEPALILVKDNSRENEAWYQDLTNHVISSQNKIFLGRYKLNIDLAYQMNNRKLRGSELTPVFTLVDMDLNTFTYHIKMNVPTKENTKMKLGLQGMSQSNKNYDAPQHVIPDARLNDFSVFAIGQHLHWEKLMIEAGLRYDYRFIHVPEQEAGGHSHDAGSGENEEFIKIDKTYQNLSGSVGASFFLSDSLHFTFNLASAFRSPNLAELTQHGLHGTRFEMGNDILESQRSLEADLSLHYHSSHTTLNVAGFYNNINNYIHLAPINDTTEHGELIYMYSQTYAFLYGGEILFHVHPRPLDWLHLKSTWSYVIGKKTSGEYLPFIPAQKIHLEVELQKKKWKSLRNMFINAGMDYVFQQNKPAQFETTTPYYFLVNFGLGTDIMVKNQRLEMGLFVNNLLNETYIDHLSTLKNLNLNDIGRNFTLSLKIPFGIKN